MIYGARTSLLVAGVATTISMSVGITVGVIAGYYRGFVDTIVMRLSDVVLALPQLLLAIGVAAACGSSPQGCLGGIVQPGLGLVIFVISAFTWPYIARIVRSTTLSLREKEFVEAARSLGASDARIIIREILPNLVAPITIWATLLIPSNILFEAALSFLGVGVPIDTPSWGQALSNAANSGLYKDAPWLMIFPGVFLVLTTLAFNLLGDGLRDALDPQERTLSSRTSCQAHHGSRLNVIGENRPGQPGPDTKGRVRVIRSRRRIVATLISVAAVGMAIAAATATAGLRRTHITARPEHMPLRRAVSTAASGTPRSTSRPASIRPPSISASAIGIYSNLLVRTLVGYNHVAGAAGNVVVPDLATNLGTVSKDGRPTRSI